MESSVSSVAQVCLQGFIPVFFIWKWIHFALVYFKPNFLRYDLHKLKLISSSCVLLHFKDTNSPRSIVAKINMQCRPVQTQLSRPSSPACHCHKSLLLILRHTCENPGCQHRQPLGLDALTRHGLLETRPCRHMNCRTLCTVRLY